tara:strand:+ start:2413 stop:2616 length:204 start_codon:yes stop_codon:yes gene_type:complete
MKTKVIIENGYTKILLTPENDFETDVIEKIHDKKHAYQIDTSADADYNYGSHNNYRIEMNIKEVSKH